MGFEFKVDSRCLIPRPETELIVEKCIKLMSRKKRPDVLDIGTGSGNIAVSIAKNIPDSRVAALDISEDALVLARENAAYHKADVSFLNSDLFESIPEGSIFDLIVSNPPYIAKEEMIRLPNEVKDFEPLISLNGGERGTEFYSRIVKDASRYLKPEGFLVLEIGWNQLEIIKEFIKKSGYLVLYNAEKDHAGFDRIITARKVTTNG
jgi:release factor glutamine methyltransferase